MSKFLTLSGEYVNFSFFYLYFAVYFVTASYMGIKDFVPPYLDPSLSLEELMTGVSFASGSSGFDPLTAQLSVRLSLSY